MNTFFRKELWNGKTKERQRTAAKHQIMLRLTDTEYEIIAENAKSANLPLAEYVRKQVMKQKVIAKYEIVTDLPELKKLVAEFGKIGSNLSDRGAPPGGQDTIPV